MIRLIRHAVNNGVTFLDTSDQYGPHINELLIGKAIKGMREKVQIASKFGISFKDGKMEICGEPEYVRACCEASLKRLDINHIDLYYVHRIDTRVPIEVTMGEMKKLLEENKIKYIGLSEASATTIRRAHAVHPITAVQMEWSLWTRDLEEEIVPTCRELGIGIVPYSPLGRGFFSAGPKLIESLPEGDFRKSIPRFNPENFEHNKKIFEQLAKIASRKRCTTSQLALAWILHNGDDICPIPGTTKVENLNENIEAISVNLTTDEMRELQSCAATDMIKGERHAFMWATWINSDTPPLSSWKTEREKRVNAIVHWSRGKNVISAEIFLVGTITNILFLGLLNLFAIDVLQTLRETVGGRRRRQWWCGGTILQAPLWLTLLEQHQ